MDRSVMAADVAHQAKIAKHAKDCKEQGIRFEPLIFETAGFIRENTIAILKDLASRRAIHKGLDPKWSLKRLLHRINKRPYSIRQFTRHSKSYQPYQAYDTGRYRLE